MGNTKITLSTGIKLITPKPLNPGKLLNQGINTNNVTRKEIKKEIIKDRTVLKTSFNILLLIIRLAYSILQGPTLRT